MSFSNVILQINESKLDSIVHDDEGPVSHPFLAPVNFTGVSRNSRYFRSP